MIKSFLHRGLKEFVGSGLGCNLHVSRLDRLNYQLAVLDVATCPQQMDIPGFGLCQLKKALQGYWAVYVSDNYYLTFKFEMGNAVCVDLILRLEVVHD